MGEFDQVQGNGPNQRGQGGAPFHRRQRVVHIGVGVLTDEYMYGGTIGTTINDGSRGVGKLPRLFHRFHSCSSLGSRPGLSARNVNTDHRPHPQAAQDGLLRRGPRNTGERGSPDVCHPCYRHVFGATSWVIFATVE
jgi:hypothetical protein